MAMHSKNRSKGEDLTFLTFICSAIMYIFPFSSTKLFNFQNI